MKLLIPVMMAVGLSACGGKPLFSSWTNTSTLTQLDLKEGKFATTTKMGFLFKAGSVCICNCYISGAEDKGNVALTACLYTGGGSGNPDCSALNAALTYTKSGSKLAICGTSGCSNYE